MYITKNFDFIEGMFNEPWKGVNIKKIYDPERYELVEKKDYKVKQLKARIEYKKELIEKHKEQLRFYEELLVTNKEALKKLEKELKELE